MRFNRLQSLFIALLFPCALTGQDTLYFEDMESGGSTLTLNTTDVSSVTGGDNNWIVNNAYTGGNGSVLCFGFPFTYTINNTPAQPGAVTNSPNSSYLHTISVPGINDMIYCSSFVAADGFCFLGENTFTRMSSDIITTGYSSVTLKFWWACGGGTAIHGEVYYSTNGGSTWTLITSPVSQYKNQTTWVQQSIALPAFDGQGQLRFGFRFVNQTSSSAVDPGFSIDDITITGMPVASITTDSISDSTFCPGDTLSLWYTANGTFSPGNVFSAELSDNAGSFASPAVIGSVAGTTSGMMSCVIPPGTASGTGYRIRVNSSNPAVTGFDNGTDIEVLPDPNGGTAVANRDTVCYGDTTMIDLQGYAGAVIWEYSFDGQNWTSTPSSPVSFVGGPYMQPTWYRAVVSNACGIDTSAVQLVEVLPQPVATGQATFDTICDNSNTAITVSHNGQLLSWFGSTDGGQTWQAIANPGTTYVTPPLFAADQNVFLAVVDHGICGTDSLLFPIYVEALPQVNFSWTATGNTVTFTDNTPNAISWSWDFGDGNAGIGQNPSHNYAGPGQYIVTVQVTSPSGCVATGQDTVDILVGLEAGFQGLELQVRPNPFGTSLAVDLDLPEATFVRLDLIDLRGVQVARLAEDDRPAGPFRLDWHGQVPAGVYFLRLTTDQGTLTRKLVRMP